jgi:hypothetical protein
MYEKSASLLDSLFEEITPKQLYKAIYRDNNKHI